MIVVLEEQNVKDAFSELLLGLWNWFPILIRFKDVNGCISNNKSSTDIPWCDLK